MFELADYGVAGLVPPGPYSFNECLTAKIFTRLSLFFELPFNDVLRSNASMIGSRYSEGLQTLHAFPPNENILKRVIKGMADVE